MGCCDACRQGRPCRGGGGQRSAATVDVPLPTRSMQPPPTPPPSLNPDHHQDDEEETTLHSSPGAEQEEQRMHELLGFFVGDQLSTTPAMGGILAPAGTAAKDIANWIDPEHRTPLALVLSMSMTWAKQLDGYMFLDRPHLKTIRIGVWWHPQQGQYVVGCRATGIGAKGAMKDLKDDQVLSGFMTGKVACDLHIVQEGRLVCQRVINELRPQPGKLIIAGYSLGGAAALCLGVQFPQARVISFFGGAPPTRPLLAGPGPSRATHYHIVGDLISSHVGPQAARVVRIDKGYKEFSVLHPHLSARFLRNDFPAGQVCSPDVEDDRYVAWATQTPSAPSSTVQKLLKGAVEYLFPLARTVSTTAVRSALNRFYAKVACESPIPGSTRDSDPCAGTAATVNCMSTGLVHPACQVTMEEVAGVVGERALPTVQVNGIRT